MRGLAKRGISTIVGMVIFTIIAIAVLVTLIMVFNNAMNRLTEVEKLALSRASEATLANAITGWWILQGTTLVINVTNNAPRTIEIDSILIVLSNGSYIALYKGHTLGSTTTIVRPDGTVEVASLSLPLYLGAGYSANITIPNVVNTPTTVSLAVSMSPVVISISLKPYTPTAIAVAPKPPQIYMTTLNRYSGSGSVAVLKIARGALYAKIFGKITNYTVLAQNYNGTASDLELIDSVYLNATSAQVPPNIVLVNRDAKVYTNFSTNPFLQPPSPQYLFNYTNATYSSWIWGSYGYNDGGAAMNSTLQVYLSGILTTYIDSNTSIGIAYNNYTSMPTDTNWSASTKIYIPVLTGNNVTYTIGLLAQLNSYEIRVFEGVALVENTSSFYIAGAWTIYNSSVGATEYELAIIKGTPQGISILQSSSISLSSGWYIVYVEYDPLNHGITLMLFNSSGALITSISVVDITTPQPNPIYAGIASIHKLIASATLLIGYVNVESNLKSFFDDLIAGVGNVSQVTVYNVPSGTLVKILNSSNVVIASTSPLNGVALLNVISQPIISNGVIEVVNATTGSLIVAKTFSTILGGDEYQYLPPRYEVQLNVTSSISLVGVVNDTSYWTLYAIVSLYSNVSYLNVSLYAYNIDLGTYVSVYSAINVPSVNSSVVLNPATAFINTSDGSVKLQLIVYSNQPFLLSIDALNAVLKALKLGSVAPLLMVGVGGSTYIDLYQVGITLTGPSVQYLYSINAHTLFNGSPSIATDGERIYLLNSTGIYYTYIVPNANFTKLTSACRATGVGAQLAALNISGITYLVALPGDDNNTLCIVNVSSGTTEALSLGTAQGYSYSVSAYNDSCAWFVVNASGYPQLIQLCGNNVVAPTPSFSKLLNLTTIKNVGLAYCSSLNELVLLSEGGPSYVINLVSGTISRDGSLPFYPVGLGDRLGCYNGYGFFVRADETNELWVWKIG